MNMTTDRSNQNRKPARFVFEEWMAQLVLVVAVIGAVVERGISLGGGMIA